MTVINSPSPSNILLIGSPRSMKDGTYANLITRFDNQSGSYKVEKQLCDRISDGATSLSPSSFDVVHLVVDCEDLSMHNSSEPLIDFVNLVLPSLKPSGKLTWSTKSNPSILESALKGSLGLVDIRVDSPSDGSQLVTAVKKPPNDSVPINLPTKSQKASLWSFTTADAEMIDDSTLLTEEDLKRPETKITEDCNPKKAKKACKNCTCGLRELELMQEDDLPANLKNGGSEVPPKSVDPTKLAVSGNSKTFTSSCGSCYLGDAFRCSSCPYLGMPAFEPGQQVKLTANMGDDIQD